MSISETEIGEIVDRALAEDLGKGDVTTEALIHPQWHGTGIIVAKQDGVLAGVEIARRVFHRVDACLRTEVLMPDGAKVRPGDGISRIEGSIASILKAERVALNFVQRLSGIATLTSLYVEKVKGLPVCIMDTRKTTPGLRLLEKYAVRVGGGRNHRMTLGDAILIKDNHLTALRRRGLKNIKQIIIEARKNAPSLLGTERATIEIEVRTVAEAVEAAEAGADIIMLDNMSIEDMRQAVRLVGGRALIEASGGITLDNVRAVAETGVNFISVGALTHSAKALDISLELEVT